MMDQTPNINIALIGPLPPPFGGMANQTRQLAKLLEGESVGVVLVRSNAPYSPAWIEKVKGIRAFFRLVPYLLAVWKTIQNVQLVHLMANSGWSWHLFAAPVIWMASMRNVPVVVNYRGGEAETFFKKAINWVRPSMHRVERVVVPSQYLEKIFSDFNIQSTVIPNIINLERFSCSQERMPNLISPHFIVCRNLEKIYDVETAIKAFSIINDRYHQAHLTIAGEGPEKSSLEQQIEMLGIASQVIFAGRLTPEQMAELYRSADVMLNTSRVDNMPNALLEAMSAGVPIVSTDAGGIPYMVEDNKTALLNPIGDWKGIAESAIQLLEDESLYKQLSNDGKREVSRYCWESVGPQWLTLYESIKSSTSTYPYKSIQ